MASYFEMYLIPFVFVLIPSISQALDVPFSCDGNSLINSALVCNGYYDCNDESDEFNCTRYRDLKVSTPAQVEDQQWGKGLWASDHNRVTEFQSKAAIEPKSGFISLPGNYYFRRIHQSNPVLFLAGLFHSKCSLHKECDYLNTNGSVSSDFSPFEVLQGTRPDESYHWQKSMKGHVSEGAVMWGLSQSYETVFICRTRARVSNFKRVYGQKYIGMLVPSQGRCFHKGFRSSLYASTLLDYEVLVMPGFKTSLHQLCKSNQAFPCENNTCIEKEFVCDGKEDCWNGKDEDIDLCRKRRKCPSDTFPCSDGKCLPMDLTCGTRTRHVPYCLDGNDCSERVCGTESCTSDQFRCLGRGCISWTLVCDSFIDCSDGSDEMNCGPSNCTKNQFFCTKGGCRKQWERCDGNIDCEDGEDERDCGLEICTNEECRTNSHVIEDSLWKGHWMLFETALYHEYFNYTYATNRYASTLINQSSLDTPAVKTHTLCRVLDRHNARHYVGTLERSTLGGGVNCRIFNFYGILLMPNEPFEILLQPEQGSYTWVPQSEDGARTNRGLRGKNVVMGGLTDGFEIFFVSHLQYGGDVRAYTSRVQMTAFLDHEILTYEPRSETVSTSSFKKKLIGMTKPAWKCNN